MRTSTTLLVRWSNAGSPRAFGADPARMISTRLRRVLIILLLLLAAAGCDSPVACDSRCQDRYEECLAESDEPIACDVALDDCLDRCYGTGSAGPDGG